MMFARSAGSFNRKAMSLPGMTDSVSVSQRPSVASSQVTDVVFIASEEANCGSFPAWRPYTPRRGGPTLILSSAWQPVHRFSKASRPRSRSFAEAAITKIVQSAPIRIARVVLNIGRMSFSDALCRTKRGINHRQAVRSGHEIDAANSEHLPKLFRGNLHRPG